MFLIFMNRVNAMFLKYTNKVFLFFKKLDSYSEQLFSSFSSKNFDLVWLIDLIFFIDFDLNSEGSQNLFKLFDSP